MYSKEFCTVYNLFGWNYFPLIFGEQLLLWLEENAFPAKSCLDLGCGTGVLCKLLGEHGIQSSGIDLSEEMIAIARKNDPDSHYQAADMITYYPEKPVDLVTCTGDALNHITHLSDIEKIFQNVFSYLNPGGYLIFDLLNEGEISSDEPFELDFNDKIKARFQMIRTSANTVQLHTTVFEKGIQQFEEVITETVHSPDKICGLLTKIGFVQVSCSNRLLRQAENPGTTWFAVAQKPANL